jgi:hypothetical protein
MPELSLTSTWRPMTEFKKSLGVRDDDCGFPSMVCICWIGMRPELFIATGTAEIWNLPAKLNFLRHGN